MDVKSFVLQNWKWLLEMLVGLVFFIILLCKKKVKVIDVLALLFKAIPGFVLDAEQEGKDGASKYTMVFSRCVKYLMTLTGLTSEQICEKYSVEIDAAIENNCKVLNNFKKGKKDEKI